MPHGNRFQANWRSMCHASFLSVFDFSKLLEDDASSDFIAGMALRDSQMKFPFHMFSTYTCSPQHIIPLHNIH